MVFLGLVSGFLSGAVFGFFLSAFMHVVRSSD